MQLHSRTVKVALHIVQNLELNSSAGPCDLAPAVLLHAAAFGNFAAPDIRDVHTTSTECALDN